MVQQTSTYSTSSQIELQAFNANVNTWGTDHLNVSLQKLDASSHGCLTLDLTGSPNPLILTFSQGVLDQIANRTFVFKGSPPSGMTITLPNVARQYSFINQTNQIITFNGAGSYQIQVGAAVYVYTDGLGGISDALNYLNNCTLNNVKINGVTQTGGSFSGATITNATISGLTTPLAITDGGTGGNTAANARTNLGLGSMAVQNSTAVSITGGTIDGATLKAGSVTNAALAAGAVTLGSATGTLPIANGGTGSTTANGATLPVGMVIMLAHNQAPSGFVFCDGRALSVANFPALFNVLGTTWGGDGVTTFNIPDFRGRFPLGFGQSATVGATLHSTGQIGGQEVHTLLGNELPAHAHTGNTGINDVDHNHVVNGPTDTENQQHTHSVTGTPNQGQGSSTGGSNTSGSGSFNTGFENQQHTHNVNITTQTQSRNHVHAFTTDNFGSGVPHSIMPPYATIQMFIKTV